MRNKKKNTKNKVSAKKQQGEKINLLESIENTFDMINEPEFDGFYFYPDELIQKAILAQAEVKNKNLSDDDGLEILNNMLWGNYDDLFLKELYDRLSRLRSRAILSKNSQLAQRAEAVLQLIPPEKPKSPFITRCGLIHALLIRNMELGKRLIEISLSLNDVSDEHDMSLLNLHEKNQFLEQEMEKLKAEFPGLEDYLKRIAEKHEIVEEIGYMMLEGSIILYIYHEKQVKNAAKKIKKIFTKEFNQDIPEGDLSLALDLLDDDELLQLNAQMTKYALRLINAQLIENMEEAFREIVKSEDLDDELFSRLNTLLEIFPHLDEEEILFLSTTALMSELHNYFEQQYGEKDRPGNIFSLK